MTGNKACNYGQNPAGRRYAELLPQSSKFNKSLITNTHNSPIINRCH